MRGENPTHFGKNFYFLSLLEKKERFLHYYEYIMNNHYLVKIFFPQYEQCEHTENISFSDKKNSTHFNNKWNSYALAAIHRLTDSPFHKSQ